MMEDDATRLFVGSPQDAKAVLAEVRELKFSLEESNEAAEHLQTELATAQVRIAG